MRRDTLLESHADAALKDFNAMTINASVEYQAFDDKGSQPKRFPVLDDGRDDGKHERPPEVDGTAGRDEFVAPPLRLFHGRLAQNSMIQKVDHDPIISRPYTLIVEELGVSDILAERDLAGEPGLEPVGRCEGGNSND